MVALIAGLLVLAVVLTLVGLIAKGAAWLLLVAVVVAVVAGCVALVRDRRGGW